MQQVGECVVAAMRAPVPRSDLPGVSAGSTGNLIESPVACTMLGTLLCALNCQVQLQEPRRQHQRPRVWLSNVSLFRPYTGSRGCQVQDTQVLGSAEPCEDSVCTQGRVPRHQDLQARWDDS